MKTIEIDEEVYAGLLKSVSDFGDTPNSILRRLLGLEMDHAPRSQGPPPVSQFIRSTEFRLAKGAVGRFLSILSWLYERNPDTFHLVEGIKGRGRIYFATSQDLLEKSGKSVNPKEIPGTPYWVITTTPTSLKQEIIGDVMKILGSDVVSINSARRAVAGE